MLLGGAKDEYFSCFLSSCQLGLRCSKGGQNVVKYYCLSNVDFTLNDRQDDKGPSLYYVTSVWVWTFSDPPTLNTRGVKSTKIHYCRSTKLAMLAKGSIEKKMSMLKKFEINTWQQ